MARKTLRIRTKWARSANRSTLSASGVLFWRAMPGAMLQPRRCQMPSCSPPQAVTHQAPDRCSSAISDAPHSASPSLPGERPQHPTLQGRFDGVIEGGFEPPPARIDMPLFDPMARLAARGRTTSPWPEGVMQPIAGGHVERRTSPRPLSRSLRLLTPCARAASLIRGDGCQTRPEAASACSVERDNFTPMP
jgi:hypothetical protein